MTRAWVAAVVLGSAGCRFPAEELEVTPAAGVVRADAGEDVDAGPAPAVTTTGCWSRPLVIAPHNVWGLGGLVVMPEGHALTVWSPLDGGPPRDLASRFLFLSGDLSPPTTFFTPAADPADLRSVKLAANPRGAAIAAFTLRVDGGVHQVYAARFQPDAGWHPAELLSDGAPVPVDELQAAVDQDGVAIVSWIQVTSPSTRALVARVWTGSSWLPIEPLSQPGDFAGGSVLRAGGGPLIVAAWRESAAPRRQRVHAMSWYMGARTDALFPGLEQVNAPALAVSGVQALVFSAGRELQAIDSLVGRFENGAWTLSRFSALDGGVTSGTLGVDEAGRFRLWWIERSDQTQTFRLSTAADFSGAWADRALLSEQGASPGPNLLQASNGQGRGLLAWWRDFGHVVYRTEGDAGVFDTIDGVIMDGEPPPLSVGPSGARWLLVHEASSYRALGLFCP